MSKAKEQTKELALASYKPASELSAVLDGYKVQITNTALMLPDEMTPDGCVEVVKGISKFKDDFDGTYRFVIGDAVVFAQDKFGTSVYPQVMSECKLDIQDVRNCVYVARNVPPAIRLEGLSWSHHREVAGIQDPKVKLKLLQTARDNKWSREQLRATVQSIKTTLAKSSEPSNVKSSPSEPPPAKVSVTSVNAVINFIAQCDSQEQLNYLIKMILPKITNMQELGTISEMIDDIMLKMAEAVGMVGVASANPETVEEADPDEAKNDSDKSSVKEVPLEDNPLLAGIVQVADDDEDKDEIDNEVTEDDFDFNQLPDDDDDDEEDEDDEDDKDIDDEDDDWDEDEDDEDEDDKTDSDENYIAKP